MRVDVWLWATWQLRSRSLATATARTRHVRINGIMAKAASQVRVGDEVRLQVSGSDRVLEVLELLPEQVGAPEAVKAYRGITPPRLTDPAVGAVIFQPRDTGRSTKKERCQLGALRSCTAY